MKKLLTFSIAFSCFISIHGQVSLDSAQIERIARTCQLWGHIKYFHPALSDNTIDWESAFSENIEGVVHAKNRNEFAKAVQMMLDRLDDPVTKVLENNVEFGTKDTVKYPVIKFIHDSILLVTIKDYRDLEDFNYAMTQFTYLNQKMPQSRGVVFDIRSSQNLADLKGYLSWYFANIAGNFSNQEVSLPGLQARFHDGFEPETGGTSGGYRSGFYIKDQKKVVPAATAKELPIIFIVNEYAEIPIIAIGLQKIDQAKIISTHPLNDASVVETVNFPIGDSLNVSFRMSELPPGSALKADYLIPAHTDESQMIELAVQLIRGKEIDVVSPPVESKPNRVSEKRKEATSTTDISYPDLGHRLLAAAKIWTVIHYFFAYQDLMQNDWDDVLRKFIPRFIAAKDSLEYNLAVAEMYKNIEDGHGFIASPVLNYYFGEAAPPIKVRFIEEQLTIVGLLPDSICDAGGLKIGDIILEIDGEKVSDRFDRYAKYTATSNQSWLKNIVARRILNGIDESEALFKIQKEEGNIKRALLPRKKIFNQPIQQIGNDRNAQLITRIISEDIGYADLDRLTQDMVEQMFVDFKETKAIIFDMRGYPNGTAWSIAPYLTSKEEVYAANFRRYSPMSMNTGDSKHMTFFDQQIPPRKFPTYMGKTVMLIDERTISQSEHTGLFLEAANRTVFIGSQTAGANGDVTNFKIPGNIVLRFSGHDVRHIDGRQLQKIGLVPDIEVRPTIDGIRNGRDEVLEKAIEYVNNLIKD